MQLLADHKADLNQPANDGWTPAFKSAQKGHTECLQLLVDCKADLNKAKIDGATPAFISAQEGHVEAMHMRILINSAADVNATYNDRGVVPQPTRHRSTPRSLANVRA